MHKSQQQFNTVIRFTIPVRLYSNPSYSTEILYNILGVGTIYDILRQTEMAKQ